MRIAFIVTEFPALSETFILNQIIVLIKAGHDVEIFAGNYRKGEKEHHAVSEYGLKKVTRYFPQMPSLKIFRIIKAVLLGVVNFYKAPLMMLKAFSFLHFKSVRQVYALIPFLNKDFDVIHCHFGPNGIIAADLKLLGVRGKLITGFYGYDVSSYPKQTRPDVYRKLFAVGDAFVVISEHMKTILTGLGCPENRIEKIPLSVDMQNFVYKKRDCPEKEPIEILTVARLAEKKGLEYSIRAVADIIKSHPGKDICYSIVGDGGLRTKIEALVAELGVQKQVRLLGWKTDKEIRSLYAQAHIFLLSSVTGIDGDQEGTPTVLLEAQAAGIPVISTLHAGIPEIVKDGKSGFLVAEKDITGLSEKISYLIDNPGSWQLMGESGKNFIEESFSTVVLVQRLIELYDKAVAFC